MVCERNLISREAHEHESIEHIFGTHLEAHVIGRVDKELDVYWHCELSELVPQHEF